MVNGDFDPVDPAATIAALDAIWRDDPPRRGTGGELRTPLMGSDFDQQPTTVNPYWDIVRRLPLDRLACDHEIGVDGYVTQWRSAMGEFPASRDRLVGTFAWAIPAPGDVKFIAKVADGRGVVEVGAGRGYWAWQLTQSGVDVVAYDQAPGGGVFGIDGAPMWHRVQAGDASSAADHGDRVLMLCWPPYDDSVAADAVNAYTGDTLVYIGEGVGGCTGDDRFHDLLERDWSEIGEPQGHVTFAGVHCRVTAYRRGVSS